MSRNRRIAHGHDHFLTLLDNSPIAEYFDVPGDYTYRLDNECIYFSATYEKHQKMWKVGGLPIEVVIYINQFLYTVQACQFKVEFPKQYPFLPTTWTLVRSKNMPGKDIVQGLNCKYVNSWSPAFGIEKDLLNMIAELLLRL
jgi:hypothetical protein